MKINAEEATEHIKSIIQAGLVCFLHGSPGTGKSEISQAIGQDFKLKLIDIRLSQCDPTDLNGFPHITDNKAGFWPFDMWPTEHDKVPAGYNGFLIILDEFNSASLAVQAASYKIILDKCVGQTRLHPKTAIICIGNLATDNAIVNRLSTAMQSRLIHLELEVITHIWLEKWAIQHNVDHRILAYISRYRDKLYNFDPDHNDKTFANPRTWYFVSKLIKQTPGNITGKLPLIAGAIGEGIAREFVMFTSIYEELPTIQDIAKNPAIIPINDEPGMLWAVSHMVSEYVTENSVDNMMKFIVRLPVEFTTITLQNILRKEPKLIKAPAIQTWIKEKGADLF